MTGMLILMLAAFCSGALNAVAGGGAFITFPALLFAGIPPVSANASSTVALFPGQAASGWAYRREIAAASGVNVPVFAAISLVGGLAGALLLLLTPNAVFAGAVPWLLLFATVVFAVGAYAPGVVARLRLGGRGALAVQMAIAVYGGYFGGGIGFLLLAALTLLGLRDIHAMNGLRLLMAMLMNAAAVVAFAVAGAVSWPETAAMAVAAVIGGYAGALGAKRVNPKLLKSVVVLVGAVLTLHFFVKGV